MVENANIARDIAVLDGAPVNVTSNPNFILCKGCKKKWQPNLFYDAVKNKSFKRCNNCRRRDYIRRHPESLQAQLDSEPLFSNACMYVWLLVKNY